MCSAPLTGGVWQAGRQADRTAPWMRKGLSWCLLQPMADVALKKRELSSSMKQPQPYTCATPNHARDAQASLSRVVRHWLWKDSDAASLDRVISCSKDHSLFEGPWLVRRAVAGCTISEGLRLAVLSMKGCRLTRPSSVRASEWHSPADTAMMVSCLGPHNIHSSSAHPALHGHPLDGSGSTIKVTMTLRGHDDPTSRMIRRHDRPT